MENTFDYIVEESPGIGGEAAAPPSKSYTQRAVILAALDSECAVVGPLRSDDTLRAVSVFRSLGADIEDSGDAFIIRGFEGKPRVPCRPVNVGENGTLLRFTLAVLSLSAGDSVVEGAKSLRNRPNAAIVDAILSLGVKISGKGPGHTVPVRISGQGKLEGGVVEIDGRTSSQGVSALLAIAPFAEKGLVIRIRGGLVSKPYVDMTIDSLGWAGIQVENKDYAEFAVKSGQAFRMKPSVRINGDYSSAAFLFSAAAVAGGTARVTGLFPDSQGDIKMLDFLEAFGAKVERGEGEVSADCTAGLEGGEFDCADTPDLAPVLTVLGCFARGKTRIFNAPHLAYKESDRLAQPAGELEKLGAIIERKQDGLEIRHSVLSAGEVSSWGDHRVAMSLAVAGLGIKGGLRIKNAECVSKSYPRFAEDMRKLNARIKTAS